MKWNQSEKRLPPSRPPSPRRWSAAAWDRALPGWQMSRWARDAPAGCSWPSAPCTTSSGAPPAGILGGKQRRQAGWLTFAVTRVKVKQLKEKLNEQHDASWKCSVIQEVQEGKILNILILFVCKAETFVIVFTTVVDLTHVHGAHQQWLQCPPLPLLHTHFLKGTPWFIDAEPGLFLFEMCHKFSAELMNSHKMLLVILLELPLLTKVCF